MTTHACHGQPGKKVDFEIACPEAVDRDIDLNPAIGCPAQRTGHLLANFIVGEDVAFEVDLDFGGVDGGKQRREVFVARVEQGQPVARQIVSGHALSDGRRAQRDRKWPTMACRDGLRCA